MEENNNEINEKTNKKEYRLNLSSLIGIVVLSIVITVVVVLAILYIYQDSKKTKLDSYLEDSEDFLSSEIDEDDIEYYDEAEEDSDENYNETDEMDIVYDYEDYVNNENVTETTDSEDEYSLTIDDYQIYTEYAVEFLYNLNTNPFYEMTSFMSAYDALTNIGTKGQDGSYIINMDFDELVEDIWIEGLNPSTLKTIDILKNNITILSETQISVKDTGVIKDCYAYAISFEETSDNEFEGYVIIEEDDEEGNFITYKYLDVKVAFDSNYLITNLTYNEVSKDTIPSELLDGYTDDDYGYNYSYSDYIN